ncbi:MAG: galactose mutarotase [Defluviitaleaceae bacterium]|nr:galactose mutarotase [Defluviitaleaceae bacterium]
MSIKTFELANKNGMTMTVTNLGCAIISLRVPKKDGNLLDIVHGLDSAKDYTKAHPFFGVICGRVANRIGYAKFSLDGKEYAMEANDGLHHLHGGSNGFDKKLWTVEEVATNKISLSYVSLDGDSGYPGKLVAYCVYTLKDDNTLRIDYRAEADTKTVCNMTNHSYFNLEGYDAKDIYGHEMQVFSDKITAVDDALIPTGELIGVDGTPFDFRKAKTIGQDIEATGVGYDHNYALEGPGVCAVVYSPVSGIEMTVRTDSPGLQFYTGNFLDGTVTGKGVNYQKHSALCLETQLFPDCVNKPEFPSPLVTPDRPQQSYTEFSFAVR